MNRVLDLFCGAGGFSTGFERAGFDVVAGVDVWRDALQTFRANHDAPGVRIDLSESTPEQVFSQLPVTAGDVDGIIGGPPCGDYSTAGPRNVDGERARLVENYYDLIDHVQPEFFVMENVPGILSIDDGSVVDYIEGRCSDLGYELTYEKLNAADYGVPQARKRALFVAMRNARPRLPAPTHDEHLTVADVIGADAYTDDGEPYRITSPSGDGYQVRGRDPFRTTEQPAYTHTGRYTRLIPPDFEPHSGAKASQVQHRSLTQAECARIQAFPEDYDWRGDALMTQQGNAVPPPLAEAVGRAVRESIAELVMLDAMARELEVDYASSAAD